MTVKDLADLSMKHGLVCQKWVSASIPHSLLLLIFLQITLSLSAAAQAITFFIRTHLQRCEEQQDFPLLFRLVLQGSTKDDDLSPALYSRSGGNVTSKERMTIDENGNMVERATCFRRGTTVWYLSPATGAPNPFARAGIALRDYADVSAITGAECRKSDNNENKKRKRDRLRRRTLSGGGDDDDDDEGRKPQKIKLTLRLRPCLTSIREKSNSEGESSSTGTESDSEAAEPMEVEPTEEKTTKNTDEEPWTFPPYPITRISIPPYTPSEDVGPTAYYPTNWASSSTFEWTRPKLGLYCVDSPRSRRRSISQVPNIATPPPESDDEFGFGDTDDEELAPTQLISHVDQVKQEPLSAFGWNQTSNDDLIRVKTEPGLEDIDLTFAEPLDSKRSSSQTLMQIKSEDYENGFNFDDLNTSIDELSNDLCLMNEIKQEDFFDFGNDFSWGQPLYFAEDVEPVCEPVARVKHAPTPSDGSIQLHWNNVELLGPESVDVEEFDTLDWESHVSNSAIPSQQEFSAGSSGLRLERSVSPTLTADESIGSSPSPSGSGQNWKASSPETEVDSTGPASPPCLMEAEDHLPAVRNYENLSMPAAGEEMELRRSPAWDVPPVKPASSRKKKAPVNTTRLHLSEATAPWERGMYTEADVEGHLLLPFSPVGADWAQFINLLDPPEIKHEVVATPLSPQEEEVFRSLCNFPEMVFEEPKPQVQTQTQTQDQNEVMEMEDQDDLPPLTPIQDEIPEEEAIPDIPAEPTRPQTRSAQRRSTRNTQYKTEEKEKIRVQPPRGKNVQSERNDKPSAETSSSSRKLRRSSRVATPATNVWNLERLRKRT